MKILPPTPENIDRAARAIREGRLVGMPTETVYGLAGDALNPDAVRRIFDAKGRPHDNPLIVHVATPEQARRVVREWSEDAELLAERFWPGALTLVLPKSDEIPSEVTGGLETVALRMPDHPVAISLIHASDRPLAAPSANRFMGLSPTVAEDIEQEILEHVEIVLNGGPSMVGLESTVLDLSDGPRILRPGAISRADIESCLGQRLGAIPPSELRKSPGMYRRHYAPQSKLVLAEKVGDDEPGLVFGEPRNPLQIRMPDDPRAYAANLYVALHRLDAQKPSRIVVALPPEDPAWEAILDRLYKASAD